MQMSRSITSRIFKLAQINKPKYFPYTSKYGFSTQSPVQPLTRNFPYGQGGQFTFNLQNRTYSLSFETIWQDYSQISINGFSQSEQQQKLFILQKGKQVAIDDLDLQKNQKEYVKIHSKIPEDYTIRGKINGSVHHNKNNVSSKTRSFPFQLELTGYKNTFQWLSLQCQDLKLKNQNGTIDINNLTVKDAIIECQSFKSKKLMFSGSVTLRSSHDINIRSIVSYQDAQTTIQNSGIVNIESLSGKLRTKQCKQLKIDRLLSCKDGINIQCDKILDQIVIQTGTGSIKCLKQKRQILEEKIKLGKMHKGRIDFGFENANSQYSLVNILA